MCILASVAAALLLAGCVLGSTGMPAGGRAPVPPGPLAPIVDNPAGGPPIECRGLPREQCMTFGDVRGADLDPDDVVRVIVTCLAVCTPLKGELRIDILLRNGTFLEHGGGGYESAGP